MLRRSSRKIIWLNFILIVISGIGLYTCLPSSPDEFPHPNSQLWRQFHGLLAILCLMNFGYLLGEHVKRKWRQWSSYPEGLLHTLTWILLIASGYLLYYPLSFYEDWLNMSTVHWYLGLLLVGLLPLHILLRAPKRKRRYGKVRQP